MARKCFMCGCELATGILCEKCDKPRKGTARADAKPEPPQAVAAPPAPAPPPAAMAPPPPAPVAPAPPTQGAVAVDPFPKAPVVPFPIDSVTPAITSVVDLLTASGVPALLVGPDRKIKFVTDEARRLFGASQAEMMNLRFVESVTGISVDDLTTPSSAGIRVNNTNVLYQLVPMAGGASGAVIVFRFADTFNQSHASFSTYVRETVFFPLRSLRDSLVAAAKTRGDVPLLSDAASTLDQVISSLELAPGVEEESGLTRQLPTVTEVVQRVASRFVAYADLKGIELQIDVQDLTETFHDHEQLADALGILMDNAFHYVPAAGQVVIGVRWMEHKGKPLLLFFVMDNGPLVPEQLRTEIFEPSFVWNPASSDRTGRGLFKCREFAVAHAGSIWVESKTGKACTFFLRVRPDGVR